MNTTTTIYAKSQEDTKHIATQIAAFLDLGDILVLVGGLAAGKTQFVKSLAHALGSTDRVTSPTFTIANFYDLPKGKLLHIDTYRLETIQHYRHLGLEEYYSESINVLEWGDKVATDLATYLRIEIGFVQSDHEEERSFQFSYVGDQWAGRIADMMNHLKSYQSSSQNEQ
ncbi:MAG: tRNA (adenosine(37)-N6)-threonylcarbamoyltransferase complex ATPase subunit type 1 TsaE [Bacteroidota bacterium]